MNPLNNINLERKEALQHQVYIIQLDPNVQIETQAIPLHILENKRFQPPLLLFDPIPELTKEANELQKIKSENESAQINSVIPVASINDDINQSNMFKNEVQINAMYKQNNMQSTTATDLLLNYKNNIEDIKESKPKDYEVVMKTKKTCLKQKIKNYVHIYDVKVPPRAIAVLPTIIQMRGKWISPRRTLSACVRFGPVQGIRKTILRSEAMKLFSNMTSPIFLLNHDKDYVIYIDVSDQDKSNWIGLLPLGEISTPTTATTANVWIYEEKNELYALTMQPIGARRPLRLGYSKKYVEDHEIPQGAPVLDLETENPVQWWCNECNLALASSSLLQRHTDVYHKDEIKTWQSPYRCRYCKKPFGRLFTLKRHMLMNCVKRTKKAPEKSQESTEPNEPNIGSVLDDSRIPSDESFQNFTNSLDFSTNLFDTDRIAGLDISGHSRADSELNPYSIGFRDDNGLSNYLDFTKLSTTTENVQSSESNEAKEESLLDTCAYCKQVVVKKNKNKHLRQCPSRLICECGRIFRHKKSLARHIHKCHNSEKPPKTDKKKPEETKEMAFKCQECPFGFKRRGMLVNHLWRIHKMISTTPVEKKVRHYPCGACPKIYRSATKRNLHVKVHHPGAENLRPQSIEGGVKSCQPASCTECPRQYVTRAKLLQHVRAQHTHLAKAMKQQTMKHQTKSKAKVKNNEATTGDQLQFDFD